MSHFRKIKYPIPDLVCTPASTLPREASANSSKWRSCMFNWTLCLGWMHQKIGQASSVWPASLTSPEISWSSYPPLTICVPFIHNLFKSNLQFIHFISLILCLGLTCIYRSCFSFNIRSHSSQLWASRFSLKLISPDFLFGDWFSLCIFDLCNLRLYFVSNFELHLSQVNFHVPK